MINGYPKGTIVRVRITASGLRRSYPAANWLTGERSVTLLEDAPGEGTLDVLDVSTVINGERVTESIYDFNIIGRDPLFTGPHA